MKIEKEVFFKLELEKEEILLIKNAIGDSIKNHDALGNRELELASELHKHMCQVILDV